MKNLNYSFLLFVSLLLTSNIGQSQNNCADNLLPNPDFENATPFDGWSTNLGTVLVSDDAVDGDHAALLTGYPQAQISETLPAEAGKRYTFSAMAKMEGDVLIEGRVRIKFLTSNYQTIGFGNDAQVKLGNDYEEYAVKGISPANTAFVQVAFYKRFGDGFFYADNMCLTVSDNTSTCDPAVDAPQFVRCPGTITRYTEGTSAVVSWSTAGYTCQSGDIATNSHDSGDVFPLGTTTVTLTRTNYLGLSNTCAFDVNVIQIDPLDCSNNILSNGGFENGFDNWDGNINNFSTLIPESNSGANAAYLGMSSLTELSQTVPATAGRKYTLQAFHKKIGDVAVRAGVAFIFLDEQMQFLEASNMDIRYINAFSNTEFEKLLWQDVAPVGTAFLKVAIQKQSGASYFTIDDLCLVSDDIVVPPPPGSCANNLLTNAGFEENNNFFIGWTTTLPGNVGISNNSSSGNNAIRLSGTAYTKLIQTVPAVAGEKYTLSAQIQAGTSNYLIRLRFRNAQGFQLSTFQYNEPYTGEYQEVTIVNATAPTNATTVSVELIKLPNFGDVFADDICLTKESIVDPCTPDITPPSLTACPPDIVVNTLGGGTVVGGWNAPTATDICSSVTISSSHDSDDFFEPGTTTVMYTAIDDAGNTSTCSFTITILETGVNVCEDNLLANPGFEEDNNSATDWDVSGGASFAISSDAFSGGNALEISGSPYGRIEQSFSATPGETYTLSARIKSNFQNHFLRLKERDANGGFVSLRFVNPISTGEYEEHSISLTANENTARIIVSFIKQPGDFDVSIDDVCFTTDGPTGGDPCEDVEVDIFNNQLTVNGINDAVVSKVQVFDANWQPVYSCFGDCDPTPVIPIGNGLVHIKIGRYTSAYALICEKRFDPTIANGSALVGAESQNHFYFKANKAEATTLLNWTTNSTFTTEEFIVERSVDGDNYKEIGSVINSFNDDGIYNFQFTDERPEEGENNYRIKIVERDGTMHYSEARPVNFAFGKSALALFPNPASDYLMLRLPDWGEMESTISIYNQLGVLMRQKEVGLTMELQTRIDLDNFPAGLYTVLVTGEGKRMERGAFVVVER